MRRLEEEERLRQLEESRLERQRQLEREEEERIEIERIKELETVIYILYFNMHIRFVDAFCTHWFLLFLLFVQMIYIPSTDVFETSFRDFEAYKNKLSYVCLVWSV